MMLLVNDAECATRIYDTADTLDFGPNFAQFYTKFTFYF